LGKLERAFGLEWQSRIIDPWWRNVRTWLETIHEAPAEEALTRVLHARLSPDGALMDEVLRRYHLDAANLGGEIATRKAIAALRGEARVTEAGSNPPPVGEAGTDDWGTPSSLYDARRAAGRGARTGPIQPTDGKLTVAERRGLAIAWEQAIDEAGFFLRDPELLAQLREAGTKVRGDVSATMLQDLRDVLAQQFYGEGLPPAQIAKDLHKIFPHTYWGRAETIAQTETHRAQSTTQHEAYARDGIAGHKWVTLGHNSRDSHRAANGQIQPISKPFLVGGIRMLHPGQLGAPAREVVNCHCDEDPVFADEMPGAVRGRTIPGTPWLGGPQARGV
jgi:hypothetical protein